ncbi:MAG TPA: serine hydrolase domain-containing protein [Candidatus Limnocylindrales bacterium]|nr:serine hydrolase domain-containing protein [Candidatus Limnocylindrales bacterium]
MSTTTPLRPAERQRRVAARIDRPELTERVGEILNRRPAVGLAVGLVRDGRLEGFEGRGVADVTSKASITEETVFRIGSITKTFTAVAVMQLWEQGLLDLDAPANDYLRAYRLVPANAASRPATARHLLTHTAGIPEVIHIADLLHPGWGSFGSRPAIHSVKVGDPLPPLAEYYRGGLRSVVEPGTAFAYSGHGFATLGQIVEDVSGAPLDGYLREHIFEPLGMTDTDLIRTGRVESRLATGYDLGPSGARPVIDREWVGLGGGGIYSSCRDMARYVAALVGGGANEHGSILGPKTLATMFEAHYRPDPRLPGMGLAFFRSESGGHRLVGHDGILPGFTSSLLVAPDDGLGLIAFTNGSPGAMAWMPIELERLLRHLLDVPDETIRTDVPHHPEIWSEICGRYRLPERIADLRGRVAMGAGLEVFVGGGRLMARILTPVPALYRGVPLHPDDEADPYLFRVDLSPLGMPTVRLAFDHEAGVGTTAVHTDLQSLSLYKVGATKGPGLWAVGALGAVAVATAVTAARRRPKDSRGVSS